ncbi:MAG: DUF4010 domain-containing protein [Bdellovibrionaceae bacterium]|nr:DUF4010 domain-containing protein [Pseudobdellovibrionaceae bacterium]
MKQRPFWVLKGKTAVLALIAMAVVVSFLPEKAADRWGLFEPRSLGTLFVAFGAIQVIGSFLVQRFGRRRGRILSGAMGGLVSSTAYVTRAARQSRLHPEQSLSRAAGAVAANLGMILEAGVLLFIVDSRLGARMLPVLVAMGLGSLTWLYILRRVPSQEPEGRDVEIELSLRTQLILTLLIGGLILLTGVGKVWLGSSGAMLLTAVSSLFEVHGTLVANGELFRAGALSLERTHLLLMLGLMMANVSKVVLAGFLGSRAFLGWMAAVMATVSGLALLVYSLG